ncbi:MAG: lysine-2,3-aminomutase-like protein [Roseomonas sp.]|nr:lysine-2,3-aminomutase-like protein [Roseomonas sp.]MCA3292223.1 lysine-2,3-aminomutase-like protein [Roseomonas sp.]MCA3294661.1 lysine-2,3-aminomutase-like protein [Roseomonas sp.]
MPEPIARDQSGTLRSPQDLLRAGLVAEASLPVLEEVAARYATAITPAMAALITPGDPADPIGLQYIPDAAELITAPHELEDPTADAPFTPVKGVVHRYPDRALLKPLLACPVYCRFCFRREKVGPDGGVLTEAELESALLWFEGNPAIREVILTGGDPLMLSARRLGEILGRLAGMAHIETLRIHTRVPVADPARVTGALVATMRQTKPVFIAVHANHAREFTPDAVGALARLAEAGVPLLGQTVLLRGVNDEAPAMEALLRAMIRNRIKPYYLHSLDPAPGTARFQVAEEDGLALMAALRGRLPGHALPLFIRETPMGGGKRPVE